MAHIQINLRVAELALMAQESKHFLDAGFPAYNTLPLGIMLLNFIKLFLGVDQIIAGVHQIPNLASIKIFPQFIPLILIPPPILTVSVTVGYVKFIAKVLQGR